MDIFGREELHKLCEHILQEGEHVFFSGAHDLIGHTPLSPDLVRASGASQLRISREGSEHVTRQVDLRDDNDPQRLGVGDHLADLVLGVISAIADTIVGGEVLSDHGTVAEGSYLGELGVFLNLNPPALVLGEVPVQAVELVYRHDIEVLLDLFDGEEMPGAVKVHAPVSEPGFVLDRDCREHELLGRINLVGIDGGIGELLESLDGIEESVLPVSLDHAVLLCDVNRIFLRTHSDVLKEHETFHLTIHGRFRESYRRGEGVGPSAYECDPVREVTDESGAFRVDGLIAVEVGTSALESAFADLHTLGIGNHIDDRLGLFGAHHHRNEGEDACEQSH